MYTFLLHLYTCMYEYKNMHNYFAIGKTMVFSPRVVLCFRMSSFLLVPTALQGQSCTFPTEQDVMNIANQIFDSIASKREGIHVQDLLQVHFTCLATSAEDMYTSATVVATFTTTSSSDSTTEQYQLVCTSGAWVRSSQSGFKDQAALPGGPYNYNQL